MREAIHERVSLRGRYLRPPTITKGQPSLSHPPSVRRTTASSAAISPSGTRVSPLGSLMCIACRSPVEPRKTADCAQPKNGKEGTKGNALHAPHPQGADYFRRPSARLTDVS